MGNGPIASADRTFKALIDVSRLVSRVGFGPHTGVDRVEFAYLEWCLSTDEDLYGMARVSGGFALLDRSGLAKLHARIVGRAQWGSRDLRGLVGLKTPSQRARAESDVRRLAIEFRKTPSFSANLSHLTYLNIGHSNLGQETLHAISAQVATVCVFLHDVIPLEFPEFQRSDAVNAFKNKVEAINSVSDIVVFNSADTRNRAEQFLPLVRRSVVAHLGIDVPEENRSTLASNRPYFLVIGTIEPRKNHQLLLDVWAGLKEDLPQEKVPLLHIVGRRGWKNEGIFEALDQAKPEGLIVEHSDLSDADMWPLLMNAKALLFPSFAEGFGLPSLEAAALGVPVICGDLAIHRELLSDYPVYVDLHEPYLWKKAILEQTQATNQHSRPTPHIPTWDEHFVRVNQAITEKR